LSSELQAILYQIPIRFILYGYWCLA